MKQKKLAITNQKLEWFLVMEDNPRIHTPEQIKGIEQSIKKFGMIKPILTHNRKVIAGHGRLQALKNLKAKTAPCIKLDHLTEAQALAYAIVDNKTSDDSYFDDGLLVQELEYLTSVGFVYSEELADDDFKLLAEDMDQEAGFEPDVKPTQGGNLVDQDDIEKAEQKQRDISDVEEKDVQVLTCPNCEKEFAISG